MSRRAKTQPAFMVVVGPQGCGKSRNAERIMAHFGLSRIWEDDGERSVEDWPAEGRLILTQRRPKSVPYRLYEDVMAEIERAEREEDVMAEIERAEEAERRRKEVVEGTKDAYDPNDNDDLDDDLPISKSTALDVQIGGEHYKSCAIQPVEFAEANGLRFLEGCVVKRVTRHDKPTGKGRQDIEKAIHELQLLLELRYPEQAPR